MTSRKQCLVWLAWFYLGNTIFFHLIGLRYLLIIFSSQTLFTTSFYSYSSLIGKGFVIFYILCAFISHFSVLIFLLLIASLSFLLFNNRLLISVFAVFITTLASILLIADSIVFSMFHFHLNLDLIALLLNKEYGVIHFLELTPLEISLSLIISGVILLAEIGWGWLVWHKIIYWKINPWKKLFGLLIVLLWISYSIYIIALSRNINVFAQQMTNLPLFNDIISLIIPPKQNFSMIERISETRFAQPVFPVTPINTPLHPLNCSAKKLYNVVIIAIDSWRFDAFNSILTPKIDHFARQAFRFRNHFSGGNSTQAGLFSMFYSLPSSYWGSALKYNKGAVLFHELNHQGYQTNILFSSDMIPPFHKTIFNEVKSLRITHAVGKTIPDRDRTITQEFKSFLKDKDKHKPFFAFLFYDATHGYYQTQNIPKIYPTSDASAERLLTIHNNQEAIEIINRYKNAIHFVDNEVGKVIDAIKSNHLLEQTIIIITSDHGEEFNDTSLYYWGHGSNYSDFQIKTPLIIHWPGHQPKEITYQTSHYDIVPFLMKNILGCTNPFQDYSIGENLLKTHKKDFLLVGSYLNIGIHQENKTITLQTSGTLRITNNKTSEWLNESPDPRLISNALLEMQRYHGEL